MNLLKSPAETCRTAAMVPFSLMQAEEYHVGEQSWHVTIIWQKG